MLHTGDRITQRPGAIFRADLLEKKGGTHKTEMMALGKKSRGGLSIDASLGICTLPVVEKCSAGIRSITGDHS